MQTFETRSIYAVTLFKKLKCLPNLIQNLEWDIENQKWKKYQAGVEEFNSILWSTRDPETHSYMMVLEYAEDGNLREYLKINFNNINWAQKLYNLWYLSLNLMRIYRISINM
ncbi:hypothetical protein Glove_15g16 [Diversispora epigaea]|uniref:Protein kinase domain-containing protein n=1 Tax=Diversispora epigaea TaxID=1348612 RepID=A0A397JR98_9GLOM|nr:hypothetical protein Glove_15g16 [Diversispora epigaea]